LGKTIFLNPHGISIGSLGFFGFKGGQKALLGKKLKRALNLILTLGEVCLGPRTLLRSKGGQKGLKRPGVLKIWAE